MRRTTGTHFTLAQSSPHTHRHSRMHARPRTYITSAARPATTLPTCTALAAARGARLPALAYPSASKNVTFALAVTLLADDAWPKPSPLIVMSVTRQEYLQSMSFSSTVCAAAYV